MATSKTSGLGTVATKPDPSKPMFVQYTTGGGSSAASSNPATATATPTLTMAQAVKLLKENNVPYGGQAGSTLKNWEQISNYVGANLLTSGGSLKATASPITDVKRTVSDDTVKTSIVSTGGAAADSGTSSKSTTYAMADEARMSGMDMERYRSFYSKMKGGRNLQAAQLLSPYQGYGGPRSTAIGNANVQTATKMLLGN